MTTALVHPTLVGPLQHLRQTLRLNFRSVQALIYGYLVPIIFLVAFGSVFQDDTPRLVHQMGQILTISLLGSTCFGLPTALVAERERGVWRRYRLLPIPLGRLLLTTALARLLLAGSAALLQIVLAHLIYGTPFPNHPLLLAAGFGLTASAFLGLGLVIAACANDVPAVQALGQCIFLPMILIGGVGVPLAILPTWAQWLSGFMPGRYAVALLETGWSATSGRAGSVNAWANNGFSIVALLLIGGAAVVIGTRLFRWDSGRSLPASGRTWILAALASWLLVGGVAASTGRLHVPAGTGSWAAITPAQIAAIGYDRLPPDSYIVTPLARPFDENPAAAQKVADWAEKLRHWEPGQIEDTGQAVRNLLCVASIADLGEDPREAEIARAIFDQLRMDFPAEALRQSLAWAILEPDRGSLVVTAPELGLNNRPPDWAIRNRNTLYAQKFLGRLTGKISE